MQRSTIVGRSTQSVIVCLALGVTLWTCDDHRAVLGASRPVPADTASDRVDALFTRWNRIDSPGCSVGIGRNGVTLLEKGYGAASLESSVPITPATVFHVASVSKQFTAASVLLLAQAGKLSLDDEVRRHIPEWADRTPVTIRQLLTHTSGLRDAFLLIELAAADDGSVPRAERLVGLLARQRGLNSAPGSEYFYNNGGYVLLAEIVKRVTGQSLRAYADAAIFRPLGMTHTHFHDDPSMIVPHLASGYSRGQQGLHVARALDGVVGNAGLFTTTGDLLLWEQNLATGRVGGAPLVAAMEQPTPLTTGGTSQYGLGLMIGRHRGLRTVSHGGNDPGASGFVVRYPEHALAIAILCNLDDIDSIALSQQIAEIHLSDAMAPAAQDSVTSSSPGATRSSAQLAENEGLYRDPATEGLLRMFVRDGTLMGSSGAGTDGGWPTRPIDARRFMIPGTAITLEFEPAARAGGRTLRVVGERPAPFMLERLAAFTPASGSLPAFAGDYAGAQLATTYTITAGNDGLSLQIPGRKAIALEPIYPDGFAGSLVGVIRFARDAKRTVTGFTLNATTARGLRFERVRPSAAP